MSSPVSAHTRGRRTRIRRLIAPPVLAALMLVGGALPALADSGPADPGSLPPPPAANPVQAAQLQARATGQAVPVGSLSTQTDTVVANPDGSFTQTTNALPVQVQQNGAWTPVDATLVPNPDGTYSPKATPSAVSLSGGGTGALATLTDPAGHQLALTLPFALPAPTLDGDSALYSSVLPGVDLQASVDDQGAFRDVLIVHNAAAAANPALATLKLATTTRGLTLGTDAQGGLRATSTDGTVVFSVPAPAMWDSTTTTAAQPASGASAHLATRGLSAQDTTAAQDTTSPDTTVSSADGPGTGAQVSPVTMTPSSSGLTLTPDPKLLTGSNVSWPVFIDPSVVTAQSSHYVQAYSAPNCQTANTYDVAQKGGEGIGYVQPQWASGCDSGAEESFFTMDLSGVPAGAVVSHAQMNLTETFGADGGCNNTWPVTLKTTGSISSATNWTNRPSAGTGAAAFDETAQVKSANTSSGCGDRSLAFDVTTPVKVKFPATLTFGLYGTESTSSTNYGHMRFSTKPNIQIDFDLAPVTSAANTTPTAITINNATGAPVAASPACNTGAPAWIGRTSLQNGYSNLTLHSTSTSPLKSNVTTWFSMLDNMTDDGTGHAASATYDHVGPEASPQNASLQVTTVLQDGHQYTWNTQSSDGTLSSNTILNCRFDVDTTPPAPATITNPDFPPAGGDTAPTKYAGQSTLFTLTSTDPPPATLFSCIAHGACTPISTCTLAPCLPGSGLAGFRYSLDQPIPANGGTWAAADSSGTAQITLTPSQWGSHVLYVEAVDHADNTPAIPATYTFYAPWNPATRVTDGDLNGDGVPDMLATDTTGDLILVPGNTDPATADTTIASTPATSPDGSTWNSFLITHRGMLRQDGVDDLFAYNKNTHTMWEYSNDITQGGIPGHFTNTADIHQVTPPTCTAPTGCATYPGTWNSVTQIIAPGDLFGTAPALITMQNGQLWLFQNDQASQSKYLTSPTLLGDGDWSNLTLIAPGTVAGTPTLWARDKTTGNIYSFPLTPDTNHPALPAVLHAPTSTTTPTPILTLPPTTYPLVASPGDVNSPAGPNDGYPDLYTTDSNGELTEYPGTAPGSPSAFGSPIAIESVNNTSADWWRLNDGSPSPTAADTGTGPHTATLSPGATWATDPTRGTVLSLNGTTGYASTTGPTVHTNTSYTVSAWVKLNSLTANSTFVSQSDDPTINKSNGLQLYYSSGAKMWAFNRCNDDTGCATFTAAYGGTPATDTWTHLVGVYDATAKTMTLYVNGQLAATTPYTGTNWDATGPLQIGRRLAAGNYGEYGNATISNVRLYNTALPTIDAANAGETTPLSNLN